MQTFKLTIEAESIDGRAIKSHIGARIDCERSMAVSLMAKVMEQDEDFKQIVTQALVVCITGQKFSETMSDEEYDDYTSNDVEL